MKEEKKEQREGLKLTEYEVATAEFAEEVARVIASYYMATMPTIQQTSRYLHAIVDEYLAKGVQVHIHRIHQFRPPDPPRKDNTTRITLDKQRTAKLFEVLNAL